MARKTQKRKIPVVGKKQRDGHNQPEKERRSSKGRAVKDHYHLLKKKKKGKASQETTWEGSQGEKQTLGKGKFLKKG